MAGWTQDYIGKGKYKVNCRFCNKEIRRLLISLGLNPLANSYLSREQLSCTEPSFPLDVYICDECFLVQLPEFESPENIFSDYAYFSSYSDTWLRHARDYAERMTKLFGIDSRSYVVEIASNDGYLLQYFKENGIPVLGIEPARNVAEAALRKGIPTETIFFGTRTAREMARQGKYADLLIGNNVLAHVPGLNDFVAGLKIILKPNGVITMEFPHLMRLIDGVQFDTIYHEHFSYFSFFTVENVFAGNGLQIFDVEELPTHGGSLRIYAKHAEDKTKDVSRSVYDLRTREINSGYKDMKLYLGFAEKVAVLKREIVGILKQVKDKKKTIVGYGAPAKGNTLLNFCGISTGLIDYTVDRNPHKQGHYLPGSRIPIESVEMIKKTKPDYVFILPWNIKDEIMEQNGYIREWGGNFIVPIPEPRIY
jgi:hypothetical protein